MRTAPWSMSVNMNLQNWRLPVFDNAIHPHAKFHYFIGNNSLCGHHAQDNDFFQTSMLDCGVSFSPDRVCKRCLRAYLKLQC